MIMKSSSLGGNILNIVIVLHLSIQISRASLFGGDDSELLELGEEESKPRFFFGNNGSLILDTRTTLILAALFGPLLAAIPILLALLGDQGNDNTCRGGQCYGGQQSGYGGGHSGYGGGGGSGSSGSYGGYGYARNTAVENETNKQQRNFKKRSPMEEYESSGKFHMYWQKIF